jgi:hypothetical protein
MMLPIALPLLSKILGGVAVLAVGWALWERSDYYGCVAARERDRAAAEAAKSAALLAAKAKSDRLIEGQAAALAEIANRRLEITERIIHVPVTTACASSPAMRAATHGVRQLIRPAGGGAPDAGRGPAAALPGSGADR